MAGQPQGRPTIELNIAFKPHREFLRAGSREEQKVFALLKLAPPAGLRPLSSTRAFVLAIDTSGSMAGDKIEEAIRAAQAFIRDERLTAQDQVALLHFDSNAGILHPLAPLGDKQAALRALPSFRRHSGGTLMGGGLALARQQLEGVPPHVVKRVLVLTDGRTFDEPRCHDEAQLLGLANAPIVAIGVSDHYNEALLLQLAQVSGGKPYHLESADQLPQVLADELDSAGRELALDVGLEATVVNGATLTSVARIYPSLAELGRDPARLKLGNLCSGEPTVFLLEYTVAGMERRVGRARLAVLRLSACRPGSSERQPAAADLELCVNFSLDEAAIAEVDLEVLGYVRQKAVDGLLQEAVRDSAAEPEQARQKLESALGLTRQLRNQPLTRMVQQSLDELAGSGRIKPGTCKTIALNARSRTMLVEAEPRSAAIAGVPSESRIRELTGA